MKYNESWPTLEKVSAVKAKDRTAVQNTASLDFLRKQYPAGTSIQLIAMKAPYSSIHFGMVGRVTFVDDAGQIHVMWENGKTVPVVPGEDRFQVVWRG